MTVQHISFSSKDAVLTANISAEVIGFKPSQVWCSSSSITHSTDPYDLPKLITMGTRGTVDAGTKLTPPPFVIIVENKDKRVAISVKAKKGWHRWNFVTFKTTSQGVKITLDLEGHTPLSLVAPHVTAVTMVGNDNETRMEMVSRILEKCYPAAFRKRAQKAPSWWSRPSYCGWGDQVGMSLALEGPGYERRCLPYNTQGLYERWIKRLEEAEVPIGTIIIDNGWSPAGTMDAFLNQWPDLRGFIDSQHDKGRKVLLWIATWLFENLPEEYCVMMGKKKICADPTNKKYLKQLRKQIHTMLSPEEGCYNADGFKIDQLQFIPTEHRPRSCAQFGRSEYVEGAHARLKASGKKWGIELLYDLQKTIYTAAKKAKPDALVTSSTIHPYFHDTFDMVRLHDTGIVKGTVLSAMGPRAELSGASLPHHLIDADDWVPFDYEKWIGYTLASKTLGVPCLFYAENFVQSFREEPTFRKIPLSTLRRFAKEWKS